MKNSILAKRYIAAFSNTIGQEDLVNQLFILSGLVSTIGEDKAFVSLLASPNVALSEKEALIDRLVALVKGSPKLAQFIKLLVSKRRTALFLVLAAEANRELSKLKNEQPALIVSPVDLNNQQKAIIIRYIEDVTNKTVVPQFETEDKMLGGFKVSLDNTVYDGSVSNSLAAFEESLVH